MTKRYFKNLDGLRFIAAITVALSHFELTKKNYNIENVKNRFFDNSAQISVTFFFVLSGFLVMWWFLEETSGKTTRLNLKSFYIKRILRIWPLYFFIVFATVIIKLCDGTLITDIYSGKRFIGYLFFLPNMTDVLFGPEVLLGQTWSLAVEEFFYLFFPLLLIKTSEKKLIKVLLILFITSFILSTLFNPIFFQIFFKNYYHSNIVSFIKYFERYRIYSFLAGVFASYILFSYKPVFLQNKLLKLIMLETLIWAIVALCFLLGITFSFFTHQVYSILFAISIYLSALNNKSNILLNNRFMVLFGKTSYGIYMLHMFAVLWLINQHFFLTVTFDGNLEVISVILFLITILLMSYISYKLFENPIRFSVSKRWIIKTSKKEI